MGYDWNTVTYVPVPTQRRCVWSEHVFMRGTREKWETVPDYNPLWESYESDLWGLSVNAKLSIKNRGISIKLEDIVDLPIDFDKVNIIEEKDER